MKLFKKLIVALSVLLVVGMLAACSDGNSNSGGSNGGNTGAYTLKYGSTTLAQEVEPSDMAIDISSGSNEYYSVSGKTITFTDKGLDELLGFMTEMYAEAGAEEEVVAIAVAGGQIVSPLSQEMIDLATEELTLGTDYSLEANGKIIILTNSGYQKAEALFGNNNGGGNGENEGNGGNESTAGTYTLKYGTTTLSKNFDPEIMDIDLTNTSNQYYSISGKTITLTSAGLDEMLDVMTEELDSEDPIVAIAVSGGYIVSPLTEKGIEYAATYLTLGDDYSFAAEGRIIILTESGYEIVEELFD